MVLRQALRGRGKGNMFWGCANYPSCRGIVSADGAVTEVPRVEPKIAALAASTACPNCGKPMTVRIARKGSNAGKPFLGCSGYPKCKTVVSITESNTAAPVSA
jgi:DNA topoisomerase-1